MEYDLTHDMTKGALTKDLEAESPDDKKKLK